MKTERKIETVVVRKFDEAKYNSIDEAVVAEDFTEESVDKEVEYTYPDQYNSVEEALADLSAYHDIIASKSEGYKQLTDNSTPTDKEAQNRFLSEFRQWQNNYSRPEITKVHVATVVSQRIQEALLAQSTEDASTQSKPFWKKLFS
jgi:hypothetical protein